jgi:hypothetical protein
MARLRGRRWLPVAGVVAGLAGTAGCAAPRPQVAHDEGVVLAESQERFAHLAVPPGCVLENNTWNEGAASGARFQRIYRSERDGKPAFGWEWRWTSIGAVVAYPEIICGAKPWGPADTGATGFPFQVRGRTLTVDFDVLQDVTGTYNLAFSLWAVSSLPARQQTITHEIMIHAKPFPMPPPGRNIRPLTADGITWDVYVKEGHGDDSGKAANKWTYVAFAAREPVLRGPLHVDAFLAHLVQNGVLPPDAWIADLELGNEVMSGQGWVRVTGFGFTVR